uniref:Uncharacterized protein n=1 Tax=Candidatus Kentrum sp. TC TaxID=2126339 RepID=A0A450YG01_9GAMM|nr:MAG: hypothetical protein BECKTC1821E_GA0114239_100759 [Candidatus Kentron sp. TC]
MRKSPHRICDVLKSVRQFFKKLPDEIRNSPAILIGLGVSILGLLGGYLSILVALSVAAALLAGFFAVRYSCHSMARRAQPELSELANQVLPRIQRMFTIHKCAAPRDIIDVLLLNKGFDYALAEKILDYLIESKKLGKRTDGCVFLFKPPGDNP